MSVLNYVDAFDACSMAHRDLSALGHRYYDGCVRDAALAAAGLPPDEAVVAIEEVFNVMEIHIWDDPVA